MDGSAEQLVQEGRRELRGAHGQRVLVERSLRLGHEAAHSGDVADRDGAQGSLGDARIQLTEELHNPLLRWRGGEGEARLEGREDLHGVLGPRRSTSTRWSGTGAETAFTSTKSPSYVSSTQRLPNAHAWSMRPQREGVMSSPV